MGSIDAMSDPGVAKARIAKMKNSLKRWMKIRSKRPSSPEVRVERFAHEQDLANTLWQLLVECGMNPTSLPAADVNKDPDAAVKLAKIAITGKPSDEVSVAQDQGFVWFLVIPVAGAVLVLTHLISTKADVAMQKEEISCIQSGNCTDYGFWLKMGSVAVIGWIAWDKLGLKSKFKK